MIPIVKINNYEIAKLFKDRLAQKLKNSVVMKEGTDGYTVYIDEEDLEMAQYVVMQVTGEIREAERQTRIRNQEEWADNGDTIIRLDSGNRSRLPSLRSQLRGAMGPFTLAISVLMTLVYIFQFVAPEYMEFLMLAAGFAPDQPGTWYRLLTPELMHFGIMHFLFNIVLWIWAGGMIEKGLGTSVIMILFLLGSVIPNFAQLQFCGPLFGGLSGVVYTLISFCWITEFLKPEEYRSIALPPGLMVFSVVFAFIGLLDILPGTSMANAVHFSGIAIGLLFGVYHAKFFSRLKKK